MANFRRILNEHQLPIVTKPELMAHFEDWVTDPAIKRADVESFVADKSRIGTSFMERYLVFTTSGSSGSPAILLQDAPAQAIMTGLTDIRGLRMVSPREYWKVFRKGERRNCSCVTAGVAAGDQGNARRLTISGNSNWTRKTDRASGSKEI